MANTNTTDTNQRQHYFCRAPFTTAEILPNGDVYLCCPGWLREPIGNLQSAGLLELWNGAKAKAIRDSVLDGKFSLCKTEMCPHLQALDAGAQPAIYSPLERKDSPSTEIGRRVLKDQWPTGPFEINCVFDLTCNLSCPSCRREPINYRPGTPMGQNAEKIATDLIGAYDRIGRIKLSGNGDPFASRAYWRMLMAMDREKHPHLRVMLHTNGLLFTKDRWKDLHRAHGLIETVELSVDAASGETYAVNRRGGSFETLLERLEFIGGLRKTGEIKRLLLSFVVQANNYKEMKDFIELGRKHSADTIIFSRLNDWGTFPPAMLAARSIHRPENPQHQDFLATLADPIFNERDVFIGNLSGLRR